MFSFPEGLETLPRRLAAEIAVRCAGEGAAGTAPPHPASPPPEGSSTDPHAGIPASLRPPQTTPHRTPAPADPASPSHPASASPDPPSTTPGAVPADSTHSAAAGAALGPGLHLSTPVRAVRRDGDGLAVETHGGAVLRAPRVILAVPAAVAADLLEEATGGASRALAEVPYAPVAVVGLGFRRADVDHPLDGFGFLAARGGDVRILGCLFPSSLFPGRAPEGCVALTVFAGGRADPEPVGWSEDRLVELALADLRRALGVRGEPVVRHLRRWPRAIPQYEIGHGRLVDLAARIERDLPGLTLAGNYLGGVSVPDRIARGAEAARGEATARSG